MRKELDGIPGIVIPPPLKGVLIETLVGNSQTGTDSTRFGGERPVVVGGDWQSPRVIGVADDSCLSEASASHRVVA